MMNDDISRSNNRSGYRGEAITGTKYHRLFSCQPAMTSFKDLTVLSTKISRYNDHSRIRCCDADSCAPIECCQLATA